jgi:hypothetical protein
MDISKITSENSESWSTGRYNMFTLKIEIDDDNYERHYPTLFHEYTHYLQNMTTFNGLIKIDDYIRLFSYIFANLGSNSNDPELPLKDYLYLKSCLGDKNLENMLQSRLLGIKNYSNHYEYCDTTDDDYTITTENLLNPYHNRTISISFIAIDSKKIPLNEITIRENMAMMNTMIADKKSDSFSNEEIEKINSIQFKEYNAIFDFLNNFLTGKNIIKLTYQICEISLNILPSEKTIFDILNFIKINYTKLITKSEDEIVDIIRKHILYDEKIIGIYKVHEKIADERIKLFDKIINMENNDFLKILKNFYLIILKGLSLRLYNKTLYTPILTMDYMNNLIPIIGSPLIYYKSTKEVRQLEIVENYFVNDFIFLHSTLEVLLESYFNNLKKCPFSESGICKELKNSNCNNNCLDNFMIDNYDTCLLSNSLLCTGIRSIDRWTKKTAPNTL